MESSCEVGKIQITKSVLDQIGKEGTWNLFRLSLNENVSIKGYEPMDTFNIYCEVNARQFIPIELLKKIEMQIF